MRVRHGVAASLAAMLALPAASLGAGSPPQWTDTTPTSINVTGGTPIELTVSATSGDATAQVQIFAVSLPSFVAIATAPGNPATATLTIAPPPSLHGQFTLTLGARDPAGDVATRTITLVATPDLRPVSLVGPGPASRWAYVLVRTAARSAPRSSARQVGVVGTATNLGSPNVVRLLQEQRDAQGRQWVQVSLAALPNGTTGWVRREALDRFQVVRTRLVIDRASLTADLYRDGVEVFHASIGVGRPSAPTPAGEFYIREELRNFGDAFYGPVAFGTSARSPTLTDWPGGGFIGIHGTNQPQLIPGRPSHGCIRLRNADILRLARLLPLGTPVTIR